MFRPPSLLISQIVPTAVHTASGQATSYIRASRASLPPHPPDMLTVRIQPIDGARTLTSQDSPPCRLLPPANASAPPLRAAPHDSRPTWVASHAGTLFALHFAWFRLSCSSI